MSSHTERFLDEIARQAGIRASSYAIAKHMGERYGWKRQSVQNYRKGTTFPDDRRAVDIATELGLEPMYVIACIQADRADDPELRSLWQELAEKARGAAAAVILSALGFGGAAPDSAHASAAYDGARDLSATVPVYLMRNHGSGRCALPAASPRCPNTRCRCRGRPRTVVRHRACRTGSGPGCVRGLDPR